MKCSSNDPCGWIKIINNKKHKKKTSRLERKYIFCGRKQEDENDLHKTSDFISNFIMTSKESLKIFSKRIGKQSGYKPK